MLLSWKMHATIMIVGAVIYLLAPAKGWVGKWFDRAFAIGGYTVLFGAAAWLLDFIWMLP